MECIRTERLILESLEPTCDMTHGLDDWFRMTEPHQDPLIKQPPALLKCPDLLGPQI